MNGVSAGIATEFGMNEAVKVWMEHGTTLW
ncbi:hypothetical protein RO1_01300 [Roseburia intestinalis XB6B4]|jgi:hypothetical protein|uniref:Uncharacterized protein n=1 Tax=Roseburia intestinalis XB6B4 TaxID=718255 RepID=D4KUB7_9FIRM|nr:hypothetical protein RO1_01300 [Roseburia intestinalis XB6B4]